MCDGYSEACVEALRATINTVGGTGETSFAATARDILMTTGDARDAVVSAGHHGVVEETHALAEALFGGAAIHAARPDPLIS
jgi:hypothetical protein